MTDFEKQLLNFRLTTAHILYHMPDHPKVLQTYLWQDFDLQPDFPILQKFLNFWENNLDGRLHSVTIGSVQLIQPSKVLHLNQDFYLH
ncbi:MAG: Usg family protein [Alphaproteobacteria bacterium]|nr:Usg family protein [Alphaproteobacteria bacterium]